MAEVSALARLVRAYHQEEGIDSDPGNLPDVLLPLLRDDRSGGVWFIEADGEVVGYLAICLGYSIEFGGPDAFVDELYLQTSHRGRGIGARALTLGIGEVRSLGAKALHLEVGRSNTAARRLYLGHGFEPRERYLLMSRRL